MATGLNPAQIDSRRLVDLAIEVLRRAIPDSWTVELCQEESDSASEWRPDAVIAVRAPGSRKTGYLIVQSMGGVTPSVAADTAVQLDSYRSEWPRSVGVVVAPWGSQRTRSVLSELGVGFIDPTGNIDLVLSEPGMVVRTEGAKKDPEGRSVGSPRLRGPKAWTLMKTLVEVRPPYGVRELAKATSSDPGYTSRVLRALEDERIVLRASRGPVEQVDWRDLISLTAQTYGVLDSNDTSTWISRFGIRQFPDRLADLELNTRWAITGSLAASLIAPVAAPAVAIVYADDPQEISDKLNLLPTDRGTDVILARPYSPAVFDRAWSSGRGTYVSLAQLAIDCLTGPGRMPSEGEALLGWMAANETAWRSADFEDSKIPRPRQ